MSSNGQLELWRFGYAIANTGYPDRLEPVLFHDHFVEPTQVAPARGRRGRAPHEVGVRTRGHRDRAAPASRARRSLTRLAIHTYREIPATETPFAPRVCGVLVVWSIDTTARSVTFNLLLGGQVTYSFKDDGDPPEYEEYIRTNWWD